MNTEQQQILERQRCHQFYNHCWELFHARNFADGVPTIAKWATAFSTPHLYLHIVRLEKHGLFQWFAARITEVFNKTRHVAEAEDKERKIVELMEAVAGARWVNQIKQQRFPEYLVHRLDDSATDYDFTPIARGNYWECSQNRSAMQRSLYVPIQEVIWTTREEWLAAFKALPEQAGFEVQDFTMNVESERFDPVKGRSVISAGALRFFQMSNSAGQLLNKNESSPILNTH